MSYWQEKIQIGSLSFPRFIGGPLDGITDSPFRKLVRTYSTDELLYTEMRHVACIAHERGRERALNFEQMERPLAYQIAINDCTFLDIAVQRIIQAGVDILDVNVGCPARNVIRSGSGSALMADMPRLAMILRLLRKQLSIPLTIKIRAGFKTKNALEVAQLAQDCGVDAVAIHPRLQTELFAGRPDLALAAQVKKALSIPIILSGNVINIETARIAYELTGVDGYMIGRGMWAKPWKLLELRERSAGRQYLITVPESVAVASRHLDAMLLYYNDRGLYAFRKHLALYLRGLPGAAELRKKLEVCESAAYVQQMLQSFAR